jgi:ketosteroid isomerase-like protein
MSIAQQNADVVRRGYAAFNAADVAELTDIFAEDSSWHTPGAASSAGDRVGRDAVFQQFGRYGGETDGTFKATLREVFAGPDGRVVAMHHNSGERKGKQLDVDACVVFEVEDGRIISGREYFYDLHAWDAFWS